jgi:tetratricopeptide (TPR) repeat protein
VQAETVDEQGIFLTYSAADERWASWIREELERAGHQLLADTSGLVAGSRRRLELEAELAQARAVLALVSPDYLALLRGRSLRDLLSPSDAVAVLVRECEQSPALDGFEVVDLVGLDEKAARERVLQAAKRLGSQPTAPPLKRVRAPFPGSLPPIWHVPPRNAQFLGRTDLLAHTHDALKQHRVVALTGVTGVGKTQLALEYSYRYGPEYSLVWWCRADDEKLLEGDLAALAQRLGLRGRNTHRAIRRWLSLHDGWLIVFDEAAGADVLPPILPKLRRGHVLITSLNPTWDGHAHVIPVAGLRRAEAVEYLLGTTDADESEEAAAVADLVGNLPAALKAVAEAARAPDVSLGDLKGALEPDAASGDAIRMKLTLEIQDQLRALERDSAVALELLEVMSYFAPDDIPLGLFEKWEPSAGRDASDGEPADVERLVAGLRDHGFVTVMDDGVYVNRLVRAAARDAMPEEQRRARAESALDIVSEAFAFHVEDNENWSVTARMVPHVLKVALHATRLGVDPARVSWLLNQVGLYHLQRANYEQAAEALRQALSLAERVFGREDMSIGVIANNLGSALHNLGQLDEARELVERSVSILEAFDDPPAELGISLANLASVLRDRKMFAEAREVLERAIDVERARGADALIVALRLTDLGRVLREAGDFEAARDQLEEARELVADQTDLPTPWIAPMLWNLGEVRRELGDYDGSREVLERSLMKVEGWYGPNHPEVAKHCRSLGLTLHQARQPDAALVLLQRAGRIDEAAFGPDHPSSRADSEAIQAILVEKATTDPLGQGFE